MGKLGSPLADPFDRKYPKGGFRGLLVGFWFFQYQVKTVDGSRQDETLGHHGQDQCGSVHREADLRFLPEYHTIEAIVKKRRISCVRAMLA